MGVVPMYGAPKREVPCPYPFTEHKMQKVKPSSIHSDSDSSSAATVKTTRKQKLTVRLEPPGEAASSETVSVVTEKFEVESDDGRASTSWADSTEFERVSIVSGEAPV